MGLLSLNLPVIGQSSATEDQKIRDGLASIQTLLNGNVDEANVPNLAAAFTTWKTVRFGGSGMAGATAATFLLGNGAESTSAGVGGVGTAGRAFYLDPARWAANARTTKLQVIAFCATNAVAPGVTLTVGLYPVSVFGAPAAANPSIATLGAVVAGSTAVFTTPALNTQTVVFSTEFNAPAAGHYAMGVASSGAQAANSGVQLNFELQARQV